MLLSRLGIEVNCSEILDMNNQQSNKLARVVLIMEEMMSGEPGATHCTKIESCNNLLICDSLSSKTTTNDLFFFAQFMYGRFLQLSI